MPGSFSVGTAFVPVLKAVISSEASDTWRDSLLPAVVAPTTPGIAAPAIAAFWMCSAVSWMDARITMLVVRNDLEPCSLLADMPLCVAVTVAGCTDGGEPSSLRVECVVGFVAAAAIVSAPA